MNANVQENISGIRVVKSYVQENKEISKFDRAITNLYTLFVKAESLVVLNNPLMMLTIYACIIALSWFGAKRIVAGALTTGELTSLFFIYNEYTYIPDDALVCICNDYFI